MKRLNQKFLLACGLLLTLAAFPVFAQQEGKIEINKMPFNDFALMLKQKVDAGEVDLTKSFSVELEGVLSKDGNFDKKKSKFTKSAGDEAMVEVGKSFIESFGDSGFFRYLKDFGIEKFNLVLAQDDSQVYAEIVSELKTPERARTITSGLNSLVQLVLKSEETGQRKLNDDERIFIKGINVKNENAKLTLKFAYEKSVVQELLNSKLKAIERNQPSSE